MLREKTRSELWARAAYSQAGGLASTAPEEPERPEHPPARYLLSKLNYSPEPQEYEQGGERGEELRQR